jgi:hypothetical protein
MYRGRRKARKNIYGKLEEKYSRLWDYCETLKHTNKGSCVLMKVDRSNLDLAPKFQGLCFYLAAMKKGFL